MSAAQFAEVSDKFAGYEFVAMPATWNTKEPTIFTFVLFYEELNRDELHRFFKLASQLNVPNPRPVSPELVSLASLFHPLLFLAFVSARQDESSGHGVFGTTLKACRLTRGLSPSGQYGGARYYLQSLLFLAGCTLSAAVIQNRFSFGTIESKLNRLWQACLYARRFKRINLSTSGIEAFVRACGSDILSDPRQRLIDIKQQYGHTLSSLGEDLEFDTVAIAREPLYGVDKKRFGFIDLLSEQLLGNLQCVLVYGSSVTSVRFADYDVILVVRDSRSALMRLMGSSPRYADKDINLSVYGVDDFFAFQAVSGDNLNHNARCVYGQTCIPIKSQTALAVRNFSFAFIRLRQLLGMAGFLAQHGRHFARQSHHHLYEYFVKIPMHIVKGVNSVWGKPVSKEVINTSIREELDYGIDEQMELIESGRECEAIANAYLTTLAVIGQLNERFNVFEKVPVDEADVWTNIDLS
ncbi:MAG TPA: hypothetical protein VJ728_16230 [Candidatus Binataceae bacterium]|nr:hypothetical protein [Candidatus Binataceae bacterium]